MSHTFDLQHSYHSCPKCQKIVENREKFRYSMGKEFLQLTCPRCSEKFEVLSLHKPKFKLTGQ